MVQVGREAEAVGAFLLQVVCQDGHQSFAADNAYVHVFVESLRRAESAGVCEAQVHVLRGVVAQVGTRTEDDVVYEIVLVEASSQQEAPLAVLPLVLEEEAAYVDMLLEAAVVAYYHVLHAVVVILCAEREVGGHEEQLVEVVHILRSGYVGEVVRSAVSLQRRLHVFVCALAYAAIVALARGGLEGEVGREAVLGVGSEVVEGESAALYVVLHLLGDVSLVGSQVETVAAASELVYAVILQAQLRVGAQTQIGVETERLVLQLWHLGISVAVVVVALTCARLSVGVYAGLVVVGDERDVARGYVVEAVRPAHRHQRMSEGSRVAHGFLGDDVDGAADGRRAEERRAAASDYLHTVDHVGRYLLQSVDAVERREDRSRVDQYLRVVAVETVYSDLREAAVLTVVLGAHAWLEVESLRQTGALHEVEELGAEHVHKVGRQASCRLVAVGRDHHLVESHVVGVEREVLLLCGVVLYGDGSLRCLVSKTFHKNGVCTLGQVLQEVMAGLVGGGADGGALYLYCSVGHMLAALAVFHVSVDVGVGGLTGVFRHRVQAALAIIADLQNIARSGCYNCFSRKRSRQSSGKEHQLIVI